MMNANFFNRFLGFLLALAGIAGCSKSNIDTDLSGGWSGKGFALTAEYGSPASRVAFDQDGLGVSWEPGDELYLIDTEGVKETVTLTTSITAPTHSATFKCDKSVLSGHYLVLYRKANSSNKKISLPQGMVDLNTLKDQIVLYGSLTVEDGQTSASISLAHAYAKLSFRFVNIPSSLSSDIYCGMAVAKKGILVPTVKHTILTSGIQPESGEYVYLMNLGWNNGSNAAKLFLPIDLTGNKIFFYVYGTDTKGDHVTYEFVKNGIDLKAGVNYNITMDFQTAVVSTITNTYELGIPAQFRAAAYWGNQSASYKVEADVDFTDEVCFPISCKSFDGQNHTLSNIQIDLSRCSRIGLTNDTGTIQNVRVNNIYVSGDTYVGGLCGDTENKSLITISGCTLSGKTEIVGKDYIGGVCGYMIGSSYNSNSLLLENCQAEGEVSVSGESHVGGFMGEVMYYNFSISDCVLSGTTKVSGTSYFIGGLYGDIYGNYNGSYPHTLSLSNCKLSGTAEIVGANYVGGVGGHTVCSKLDLKNCTIEDNMTISGKSCVGGICGYMRRYVPSYSTSDALSLQSSAKGEVSVSGTEKVGGLYGQASNLVLKECFFEGTAAAENYVGGLIGMGTDSSITECYVKGTVQGSQYVGGLSGDAPVNNSYFIGETDGNGISGKNEAVYNCYSYGTISGYGISLSLKYSKNLTSANSLSISNNNSLYCNCGPDKTFLSNLAVINDEEKYSTQCWPDIDAKCPLLQWQADGFGGDIHIPGFGDEDW